MGCEWGGGQDRATGGSPSVPTRLTPLRWPRRDLEDDPYFTDGFPDAGFGTVKKPLPGSAPSGKGQVSEVVSR